VRCTRGAILDIIVDLRPESPTYLQHVSVELNEDNSRALYVPERFAHGYQALRDKTEPVTRSESSTPRIRRRIASQRLAAKTAMAVARYGDFRKGPTVERVR